MKPPLETPGAWLQAAVGPAAAAEVAGHQPRAEHQQDRRHRRLREAGQLGQDRLDVGEHPVSKG